VVKCHVPGWRMRYHHHVLALRADDNNRAPLDDVCKAYLHAWLWSFFYNQQSCVDRWLHYEHVAAPTITDLLNYVLGASWTSRRTLRHLHDEMAASARVREQVMRDAYEQNKQDDARDREQLQLLAVLPPQSAHLLSDERARRLMTDVSLGMAHAFPEDFRFAKYLKYKTWECCPVLPRVDMPALARALVNS